MAAGEWIDVTAPVRDGMVHWPTDPPVRLEYAAHLGRGDPATVTRLDIGAHTGTHVDAPVHFVADAGGVDAIPIESLIGPARVIEIHGARRIGAEELATHEPTRGELLLLKTDSSARAWRSSEFYPEYPHLRPDAAKLLVARRVRTIGIDYLSIGGDDDGVETHRILLSAGIAIVEGLVLTAAPPGPCELLCLPLRLEGRDGAPARAFLRPGTR